VEDARVEVAEETVGEIGAGLLALVGVASDDRSEDAEELARKLVHLRIFEDDDGRMNRSLLETGGALCVVSQFTLFGDCRKGRRPYFGDAAQPELAEPLIEAVVEAARALGVSVETGRFRAHMRVSLVNVGPVTLLLDTRKSF
jgi:D-tyrosyl-tRNA(Tyr) deacylase